MIGNFFFRGTSKIHFFLYTIWHTFKMINIHFAQIIQPSDVIVITVGICDAKISLKITKELLKIRNNIKILMITYQKRIRI